MSILTKWQLGAKAMAVFNLVNDLTARIDGTTILKVLGKIVELQVDPQYQGSGSGVRKVRALVVWFGREYEQYAQYTSSIEMFATVVVALFKAAKLFR